jgi:hypothetical protein
MHLTKELNKFVSNDPSKSCIEETIIKLIDVGEFEEAIRVAKVLPPNQNFTEMLLTIALATNNISMFEYVDINRNLSPEEIKMLIKNQTTNGNAK